MSRRYEVDKEETNYAVCDVCDSDIVIDFYSEPGDTVSCNDCGAYYTLQSINPIRISLIDGDEDDESYLDLNFDD